ncbi:hypothetical protein NKH36_31605 [Mesorhizobium sp. M1312]|uniref:hypothetical protein n=1 Tax=unclassified Mesorhizobium TaxID=325217 RepID=UPI0033377D45
MPNSFLPSIEIDHSIAIVISLNKETLMAQSTLTNRGRDYPREVTGLFACGMVRTQGTLLFIATATAIRSALTLLPLPPDLRCLVGFS